MTIYEKWEEARPSCIRLGDARTVLQIDKSLEDYKRTGDPEDLYRSVVLVREALERSGRLTLLQRLRFLWTGYRFRKAKSIYKKIQ